MGWVTSEQSRSYSGSATLVVTVRMSPPSRPIAYLDVTALSSRSIWIAFSRPSAGRDATTTRPRARVTREATNSIRSSVPSSYSSPASPCSHARKAFTALARREVGERLRRGQPQPLAGPRRPTEEAESALIWQVSSGII